MKIRIVLLSAAAAVLACGEDFTGFDDELDAGTDLPPQYSFSTGTFGVSNAVLASQNDECGLFGAYADPQKQIGITVTGADVVFNLSNNPAAAPESLDRATRVGDDIVQNVQTNYTIAFTDTCVVRVRRTVTGQVVNTEAAALTLDFSVALEAGTCKPEDTAFSAVPCASKYQFTATRL